MPTSDSTSTPYFVYIIQVTSGAVKIGIARDIDERIAAIQTGNHEKLTLVFSISVASKQIARALEAVLHGRYKEHRLQGEWFTLNTENILADVRFAIAVSEVIKGVQVEHFYEDKPLKPEGHTLSELQRLYERAVIHSRGIGKVSVGILENKLRIDEATAIQLIDRMERSGVISPPVNGTDVQEILPSDTWYELFMKEAYQFRGMKFEATSRHGSD